MHNATGPIIKDGKIRCSTCEQPVEVYSPDFDSAELVHLCDCGKGEWCPQYGKAFKEAEAKARENRAYDEMVAMARLAERTGSAVAKRQAEAARQAYLALTADPAPGELTEAWGR